MGIFGDSSAEKLDKNLGSFNMYTSDLAFKDEITDSKFVLEGGINMFDATNSLIERCKKEGFDAIIGVGIGGGTGTYIYGTAVKIKK